MIWTWPFLNIQDIQCHWLLGFFFSCDQAALWMFQSVCPSVCPLSVIPFSLCSHHCIIIKFSGVITIDRSDVDAKGQGQRSRSQRPKPCLAISGLLLQFELIDGYEMIHKAGSSLEEGPYCFSRSSVKCQGHMGQKNHQFWPELSISRL